MKRNVTKTTVSALKAYFSAVKALEKEKILINKKNFTCQIGEWLVETIYDGKRATNPIQKGWDIDVNSKHIQVKTHAKLNGKNNRWSSVEKDSPEIIHELIIIVFSPDYKLLEYYLLPWEDALPKIKKRNIKNPRNELNWSSIKEFKLNIDSLPKQDIISIFR